MKIFIAIFIFSILSWADDGKQMNSRQICEKETPEFYKHIKGKCKWTYLDPEIKDFCSIECGHDDQFLQNYPYKIEKVDCFSGADYCNENFQNCIDAQAKKETESCKTLPLEHNWHREPGDPPDHPVNQAK